MESVVVGTKTARGKRGRLLLLALSQTAIGIFLGFAIAFQRAVGWLRLKAPRWERSHDNKWQRNSSLSFIAPRDFKFF